MGLKMIRATRDRPVCDGHEATRRIRKLIAAGEAQDTPIIALSASVSDEEARPALLLSLA